MWELLPVNKGPAALQAENSESLQRGNRLRCPPGSGRAQTTSRSPDLPPAARRRQGPRQATWPGSASGTAELQGPVGLGLNQVDEIIPPPLGEPDALGVRGARGRLEAPGHRQAGGGPGEECREVRFGLGVGAGGGWSSARRVRRAGLQGRLR